MNTHKANLDLSAIPPTTDPESDMESESELGLGVMALNSKEAGGLGTGDPFRELGGVTTPVLSKSSTSVTKKKDYMCINLYKVPFMQEEIQTKSMELTRHYL